MKYGSGCSGIEAATCAWHDLGWEPQWFSEIERFPSEVLKARWPGVPNLGDMTKIHKRKVFHDRSIDLLVGGTPCQSFSIAGLRKGLADPRGNLALTFLGLADRKRPRWLVWENVPGVLSSLSHDAPDPCPPVPPMDLGREGQEVETFDDYSANESHAFRCFLAALQELGYGFAYRVLDAQYFGVPQRRQRVFVVGYLGDWRPAAAVLFESGCLSWDPPPGRAAGKGTSTPVAPSLVSGGRGVQRAGDPQGQDPVVACFGGNNTSGPIDQATAVRAHDGAHIDFESETFVAGTLQASGKAAGSATQQDAESGLLVSGTLCGSGAGAERPAGQGNELDFLIPTGPTHTLKGEGFDASEDGSSHGTPIIFTEQSHNQEACPTLTSGGDRGRDAMNHPCVAFDTTQITNKENRSNPQSGDPSHPLTSEGHPPAIAFDCKAGGDTSFSVGEKAGTLRGDGHGGGHAAVARTGMKVRRLTPRECERLQGFPDDYTLVKYRGKPATDSPRYKAIGNSMAVPVMRWIGRRIATVDSIIVKRTL